MQPDLLVIGLGNPGKKYKKTRHNVGFIICDLIAEFFELSFRFGPGNTMVTEFSIDDRKIAVAKPLTFMNRSGETIPPLLDTFQLQLNKLLVVCDDFSLPLGTIRIRTKGSAGSHNGLQSIIDQVNTPEFPRMRIGIGNEDMPDRVDFVLSNFTSKEAKKIKKIGAQAIKSISSIVTNGIEKTMSEFNQHYEL